MPSRKGESFGGAIIDDSENSAEFGHINTERGEKTLRGNELQKRREELLKRKAELGAKLRAAGIDTDKIDAEDRAEFYAKKGQEPPEAQTPVRTKEPIRKQESVKNQEPVRSKELESMEEELANAPEVAPAVVANKLLKHKGFKVVIAGAIVGLAATLGAVGISTINKDRTSQYGVDFEAIPDQSTAEEDFSPEVESAQGIKDGYGEEGMWLSESKPNSVAFSDFESVVEMFDGDVKAAVKYLDENEVESLSDYVSAIPGAVLDNLPDSSELKQFKGLNLSDANEKIESELSAEEYDNLLQEFKELIDRSEVSETSLNGKHSNAYMAIKDGDKLVGSKVALEKGIDISHDAMQLVSCTTNEKKGTKAYELTWTDEDGNVLGSILIKGECGQIVEAGVSKRISNLPEITEEKVEKTTKVVVPPASVTPPETKTQDKPTPDKPTPDTPNTPDTPDTPDKPDTPDTPDKPDVPDTPDKPKKHTPKNEEEEKKHAGEHVEPRGIDNNVTPPTTKQQDQENFDAIEKQRQEDEEARKAAERVAEEQQKAEEAAKEEAKNREVASETNQEEVQKADDAKENAEAEAAREQEAAAEAERANREEQEQREQAQEQANAQAEQNSQEAESHADDTAAERANAFANGDF